MTVLIHIGRRMPRAWLRRQAQAVVGLMSFQENIWLIIRQSMSMAKKKANMSGIINFVMTLDDETEDMNYKIEWIKIIIQGTKEQEKEEYDEAMKMYQPLGKLFKKEIPKDDNLRKHFKSKVLTGFKIEQAYKAGHGAVEDNNISNKLLEMGILTHIEWIDDFDSRQVFIPTKS
jgi:hypothetical protein